VKEVISMTNESMPIERALLEKTFTGLNMLPKVKAQRLSFSSAINENVFKSVIKTEVSLRKGERLSLEKINEILKYIRERRARVVCKEARPGELAEIDLEEEFDD